MDLGLKDNIQEFAEKGWMPTMIKIWQEKIERLKVVRTGRLHESFSSQFINEAEAQTISMRFIDYGIYQALGTGRGYSRENGGYLEFLDKDYRSEHRLAERRKVGPAWGGYRVSGKPRARRDWYNGALYRSVMKLRDRLSAMTAKEAVGVICAALADARAPLL